MSAQNDADEGHRWYPWFRHAVERSLFDELGMHALYCAGPEGLSAVRIAVSADPRRQLTLMQIDAWKPLVVHTLAWCPDRDMAARVKSKVCEILSGTGRHLRGDWYDCPATMIGPVVQLAGDKVGCPILAHPEMLARVRSLRERRIAKAVRA